MRITKILIPLAFVANAAVTSSNAAYNKWHETELERWLADHDVPFPTPSDRKNLETLVQEKWQAYAVKPYQSWSTEDLLGYLKQKGFEAKQSAEDTQDALVTRVRDSWYETEEEAQSAWINVKDWILDTWSDSQLKAFCDRHGIPVPQPRKRDLLLKKARESYEMIARKTGETAAYPGSWLYESWKESDLKAWLTTHGFPAPQPSTRDSLISSVRRNSRLAYLRMRAQADRRAHDAQNALTRTYQLIDSWSEAELREFCDKWGIPIPKGTSPRQLRALVRKRYAALVRAENSAHHHAHHHPLHPHPETTSIILPPAPSITSLVTDKAGDPEMAVSEHATRVREAFDRAVRDGWEWACDKAREGVDGVKGVVEQVRGRVEGWRGGEL
ncbi:hypothetical protein C8A05DRAFT_30486 [Staphylotrichum tortipilum]|uniref:Uncharacterized protein n=1 Tax=Staphylotrichum tortipilum TaxID=2831512 RepID=A0AAN6RX46_9PEZI|nr:hypothetical protein C8A05DRAFT_30486 [Staphylotrichum longicolle]